MRKYYIVTKDSVKIATDNVDKVSKLSPVKAGEISLTLKLETEMNKHNLIFKEVQL